MTDSTASPSKKPRGLASRVWGSTFLLTLFGLIAVDAFVVFAKPLRFVNHTGLTSIRQNYLVSKLPDLLESPQAKDVLLTGSSTMLVPAVRCDDELHGRKARWDPWFYRNYINECVRCDFLEKQLSEVGKKPVSVCNAAVSASVLSDQYLIIKKYLSSGKRPKLVIMSMAPREFLDNDRQNVEKTATYSLLADFTTLPEIIQERVDPWRICDAALGMTWTYYRTRGDYRTFCESLAVKTSGHPLTLFNATAGGPGPATAGGMQEDDGVAVLRGKPDYTPRPNVLKDLPEYQKMYLPVNMAQFDRQNEYFKKTLTLLKKENIPTLVVNVPLTRENYAVLPPAVLQKYKDNLHTQCATFGVECISPGDTTSFTKADYEDSVHMNVSGGKKMFAAISAAVAEKPQLAASIGADAKSLAGAGTYR